MGVDAGIATALRSGPPLRLGFGSGFAADGPRAGAGIQVRGLCELQLCKHCPEHHLWWSHARRTVLRADVRGFMTHSIATRHLAGHQCVPDDCTRLFQPAAAATRLLSRLVCVAAVVKLAVSGAASGQVQGAAAPPQAAGLATAAVVAAAQEPVTTAAAVESAVRPAARQGGRDGPAVEAGAAAAGAAAAERRAARGRAAARG